MKGVVKWFSRRNSFGFILTPELPGLDVFVHFSDIEDDGRGNQPGNTNLYEDDVVEFEAADNIQNGRYKGQKAVKVKVVQRGPT